MLPFIIYYLLLSLLSQGWQYYFSVAQTSVLIGVNSWLIPCRIEKNRRKKPKMRANLVLFRGFSWLIWKNKANMQMGEIGAKSYMKGVYEDFHALGRQKNKANSKPIYYRSVFSVRSPKDCVQRTASRWEKGDLKKQSQFISYWVLRDAYCEKEFEKTKPIFERVKWR